MPSSASFAVALLFLTFLANAALFSPFQNALEAYNDLLTTNESSHDLLKRATNACPTSYAACTNEGAPGLCCANSQTCTADKNGYVACCPTGASCTGTITGVITGGVAATTTTGVGALLTSGVTTKTTTSNGLVLASATSGTSTQGFIIAASTTVATIGSHGVRSLQIPSYARWFVWLLEYIPL